MAALLLFLAGAALLIAGVTLVSIPAGLIASGIVVLVLAVLVDLRRPAPAEVTE